MPEETLLSIEEARTRAEIAAHLRSLANGLDGDGPLTVASGEKAVTVAPPTEVEFEFEIEREYGDEDEDEDDTENGDRSGELSLEVEIEWAEIDADTGAGVDAGATVDLDGGVDPFHGVERTTAADETATAEEDPEEPELTASTDSDQDPVPTDAAGDVETVVSQGQFQLYIDRAGKWRWRLVHRNGNIIATSGQGYASRQKATQGVTSVMRNAPDAEAITVD